MTTSLLEPDRLRVLLEAEGGPEAARTEVRQLAFAGVFSTQSANDNPVPVGLNNADDKGFPNTWRMVRLGSVLDVQNGFAFKSAYFNEVGKGLPIIRIRDIFSTETEAHYAGAYRDDYLVNPGDLIIGMDGNFNVAQWQGPVALLNQRVCRLRNVPKYIEPRFLYFGLQEYLAEIHRNTPYTTVKHLSTKHVKAIEFPLPPVEEQRRIVTLVDGLFRKCDELERKKQQRDTTRSCLTYASFRALTTASSEELRECWQRISGRFQHFTADTEGVKGLWKAALMLGMNGFRGSESDLRIRDTGASVVGDYASLQNGYAFKSTWFSGKGVRLVRNANISHGHLDWTEEKRLPDARVAEFERFQLAPGDIVLSLDRPVISTGLKVAWVRQEDTPCLLLQRVARVQFTTEAVLPAYFYYWLLSPRFTESIDPGRSNGVPHISTRQVMKIPFRPPDIEVQREIVERLGKVEALVDQLQAQHSKREDVAQKLVSAVASASHRPLPSPA